MTPPPPSHPPKQQCKQCSQPLTNHSFDCTVRRPPLPPPPRCPWMFRSAVIGTQQVFEQVQANTNDYSLQNKNQFHNDDAAALLGPVVYDSLKQQQKQPSLLFAQNRYSSKASATAAAGADFACDGWKSPRLTRLGMFHPLEQCHVAFPKHVLLSHMLPTLMDTFQKTSLLLTNFTDSPIGVSCESMERVQFQVNLWESRPSSDVVILEIQKVLGDALDFQAYAQQILATVRAVVTAATTATASVPQHQQYEPAMMQQYQQQPCAPFVSQESHEEMDESVVGWNVPAVVAADRVWKGDANTVFNQEQATTEALEILHSILFSSRYDACRLGLESACCMTDPSKTGWSTACLVAQALLAPANDMQKQISTRILQWTTFQSGSVGGGVDHHASETNWYAQELSYLALQALAQALQVATESQTTSACSLLSTFLETTCAGLDLDLVAILLNKVRTVQQSPHTAYFAIRALTALCQARVPQVSQRIAQEDVEYAQQVGVATHAALATVSGRLLVTLQACY
jgi:hypothetical protein